MEQSDITRRPHLGHAHECELCGLIWAHDPRKICEKYNAPCHSRTAMSDSLDFGPEKLRKEYNDSHQCPRCFEIDQVMTAELNGRVPDALWDGTTLTTWEGKTLKFS